MIRRSRAPGAYPGRHLPGSRLRPWTGPRGRFSCKTQAGLIEPAARPANIIEQTALADDQQEPSGLVIITLSGSGKLPIKVYNLPNSSA